MKFQERLLSVVGLCFFCFQTTLSGNSLAFTLNPSDRDYASRFRNSYQLGSEFSAEQIEKMLEFLRRAPEADILKPDELASIKNNVADVLITQKQMAPRLLIEFTDMYQHKELGPLWLNYIVQKIGPICLQLDDSGTARTGTNFLFKVARDPQSGYICEAFIALDRICKSKPEFLERELLSSELVNFLDSNQTSDEDKGILLQLLAYYQASLARSKAISLLSKTKSNMLKACALATLGQTGRGSDIALVSSYSDSPDGRINEAARVALLKIQKTNR